MRTRLIYLLCFALLAVPLLPPASAQPIYMPEIERGGTRVLLFVDRQETRVKVVIQPFFRWYDFYDVATQNYTHEFLWILPLPAPAIDVTDSLFYLPYPDSYYSGVLDQIDEVTRPRFEPELPRYCYDTMDYIGRSGDHSFTASLMISPTSALEINNSSPEAAINQLHDKGYELTDAELAQVRAQAEAGFSFLVVKFDVELEEVGGAIDYILYGPPYTFSFDWSEEAIPLPFVPETSTIWIFGDLPYQAANIALTQPNFSHFRAPHTIRNTGSGVYYEWVNNDFQTLTARDYLEERNRVLTDGAAVTEYAGSSDIIPSLEDSHNAGLEKVIRSFPYVTRLRVNPSEDSPYAIYEPAPEQPDLSNVIDLNGYVDPLTYWGCSSRTALDETSRANLPTGRLRVDDLRLGLAYPPDWQLNTLRSPDGTVYALSPKTVTAENVSAALQGDQTQPPMFVFSKQRYITDGYAGPLLEERNLLTYLDLDRVYADRRLYEPQPNRLKLRFDMRSIQLQDEHGVMYGLYTSESDWAEHEAMYRAMLAYAQSYQYYASADWPNTLFIQSDWRADPADYVWRFPILRAGSSIWTATRSSSAADRLNSA